jgi:parallel beta-helix repeat protein
MDSRLNKVTKIGLGILLVVASFAGLINNSTDNATAGTPKSGTISSDDVWDIAGSPYWIEGNVTVVSGANLTIDPGVDVRFNGFYSLFIEGNLDATGANFTSNLSSPGVGNWDRMQINLTGHAEINNSNISYGDYGVYLDSSSNNNITGNNISNCSFGIRLDSSSNNNITDNNISDIGSTGISLGTSSYNNITDNNISSDNYGIRVVVSSNNNTIAGNNASFSNWGITIGYSSHNNTIIKNNVSFNRFEGISASKSNNTSIIKNNVYANGESNSNFGIGIDRSSNNSISNNSIYSNDGIGLFLDLSSNNSVKDNIFLNDGMRIGGTLPSHFNTNTIPTSNTVNGKPFYYYNYSNGINIDGIPVGQLIMVNCTDFKVSNLKIDNTDGSISIQNSMNMDVSYNNVSYNVNTYGIYLAYSSNITVLANNASNSLIGIYLGYSNNNTVSFNNVSENQYGIILSDGNTNKVTMNNSISYNNVSDNYYGIWNLRATNNSITKNNVSINDFGIYFVGSTSNNRIYHNNIMGNLVQAYDESDGDIWDDGYPSGGNYWDDWDTPVEGCNDNFDGPTQTGLGGPDGICDAQYDIDMDSIDYYPMTEAIDITLPAKPTNVNAKLEGINHQHVNITWSKASDDLQPLGTTKYEVFYGTVYDPDGSGYVFLAEVPADGSSNYHYVHQNAGNDNPDDYFYYVKSYDSSGNSAKNDTQVAKFTRSLQAGKHIISTPLKQSDESINIVLQTLEFNIAWYYDNTNMLDPYKSFNPSRPFNNLVSVNHTMALRVIVTENSNFTVAGVVPETTTIELKAGWNFVGYPSFIDRTVADALDGIVYERIEGYDDTPPQYIRLYTDSDIMKPGFGFWIKVPFDQDWVLTND